MKEDFLLYCKSHWMNSWFLMMNYCICHMQDCIHSMYSITIMKYPPIAKCPLFWWWVGHHFSEHQTNSNIIFWTPNELKRVHLLMIQLEHLNFGFEWTDIKHQTNFFEQRTDSNIVRTISTLFIYYRHSIFCPKPFGIPWTRAFRSPGHWWWGLIWGRVSFRFLHFGHWRCSDVVFTSSHESSSLRTVCTNRTWIWDPVCRKSQLTGMSTVLDYKQTYHESCSQPVCLAIKP